MKRVLPSPARELWREHGAVLLEHLGRLTAGARGHEAWRLGGGTMLAARWRHRQSSDIDIAIATSLPRRLVSSVCAGIVEALDERGLDVERDEDNDLIQAATNKKDPYGRKQGIDIWIADPKLPGPAEHEQIEERTIPALRTSQILHGKMQRDARQLSRDAYDIARARHDDAGALESAVNSLTPNHQRRAEILWAAGGDLMVVDRSDILTWDGTAAEDQGNCRRRASDAIHDSRWVEVEITTNQGRVQARTVNASREERFWLGEHGANARDSETALDNAGILLHLDKNYRRSVLRVDDILRETEKAALSGRRERIIHTRTAVLSAEKGPPQALMTAEMAPEPPRAGTAR